MTELTELNIIIAQEIPLDQLLEAAQEFIPICSWCIPSVAKLPTVRGIVYTATICTNHMDDLQTLINLHQGNNKFVV